MRTLSTTEVNDVAGGTFGCFGFSLPFFCFSLPKISFPTFGCPTVPSYTPPKTTCPAPQPQPSCPPPVSHGC